LPPANSGIEVFADGGKEGFHRLLSKYAKGVFERMRLRTLRGPTPTTLESRKR
jgi:hypothetical protein